MTIRSDVAMQGIPADRATKHATAKLSAAFASRLEELQSAWMRRTGRRRLAQSIAHLDDRLLADIGLGPQDLGFAERVARSRATGTAYGRAARRGLAQTGNRRVRHRERFECGVRVVTAWTVIDSNGELLARFIAGSPREVGRKVVRNRYDPFRLEVSPSYRELFDRDLKSALAREDWQIVPLKRRTQKRRPNKDQLELTLN